MNDTYVNNISTPSTVITKNLDAKLVLNKDIIICSDSNINKISTFDFCCKTLTATTNLYLSATTVLNNTHVLDDTFAYNDHQLITLNNLNILLNTASVNTNNNYRDNIIDTDIKIKNNSDDNNTVLINNISTISLVMDNIVIINVTSNTLFASDIYTLNLESTNISSLYSTSNTVISTSTNSINIFSDDIISNTICTINDFESTTLVATNTLTIGIILPEIRLYIKENATIKESLINNKDLTILDKLYCNNDTIFDTENEININGVLTVNEDVLLPYLDVNIVDIVNLQSPKLESDFNLSVSNNSNIQTCNVINNIYIREKTLVNSGYIKEVRHNIDDTIEDSGKYDIVDGINKYYIRSGKINTNELECMVTINTGTVFNDLKTLNLNVDNIIINTSVTSKDIYTNEYSGKLLTSEQTLIIENLFCNKIIQKELTDNTPNSINVTSININTNTINTNNVTVNNFLISTLSLSNDWTYRNNVDNIFVFNNLFSNNITIKNDCHVIDGTSHSIITNNNLTTSNILATNILNIDNDTIIECLYINTRDINCDAIITSEMATINNITSVSVYFDTLEGKNITISEKLITNNIIIDGIYTTNSDLVIYNLTTHNIICNTMTSQSINSIGGIVNNITINSTTTVETINNIISAQINNIICDNTAFDINNINNKNIINKLTCNQINISDTLTSLDSLKVVSIATDILSLNNLNTINNLITDLPEATVDILDVASNLYVTNTTTSFLIDSNNMSITNTFTITDNIVLNNIPVYDSISNNVEFDSLPLYSLYKLASSFQLKIKIYKFQLEIIIILPTRDTINTIYIAKNDQINLTDLINVVRVINTHPDYPVTEFKHPSFIKITYGDNGEIDTLSNILNTSRTGIHNIEYTIYDVFGNMAYKLVKINIIGVYQEFILNYDIVSDVNGQAVTYTRRISDRNRDVGTYKYTLSPNNDYKVRYLTGINNSTILPTYRLSSIYNNSQIEKPTNGIITLANGYMKYINTGTLTNRSTGWEQSLILSKQYLESVGYKPNNPYTFVYKLQNFSDTLTARAVYEGNCLPTLRPLLYNLNDAILPRYVTDSVFGGGMLNDFNYITTSYIFNFRIYNTYIEVNTYLPHNLNPAFKVNLTQEFLTYSETINTSIYVYNIDGTQLSTNGKNPLLNTNLGVITLSLTNNTLNTRVINLNLGYFIKHRYTGKDMYIIFYDKNYIKRIEIIFSNVDPTYLWSGHSTHDVEYILPHSHYVENTICKLYEGLLFSTNDITPADGNFPHDNYFS